METMLLRPPGTRSLSLLIKAPSQKYARVTIRLLLGGAINADARHVCQSYKRNAGVARVFLCWHGHQLRDKPTTYVLLALKVHLIAEHYILSVPRSARHCKLHAR